MNEAVNEAVNDADEAPPARPFLSDAWHRIADVRCALRPGLQVAPVSYRGRPWFVLHEPASGRVHRLSAPAWAWLGRLSLQRSIDETWRAAVEADPATAPGQSEVVELLADLFAADLLQSDRPSELATLIDRRRRLRKSVWLQNLGNPLSLRIPLWNPDRFLGRLTALLRPLIGAPAWLLWSALVLPALLLGAAHEAELTANLADRLLSPDQWLLLLPLLFVAKLVHELAHGVMVRAGGGHSHEMGLMLLVLVPVPYIDASAANSMPSRWRRAAVGAAGMWIELAICALALYAWLLLEAGFARGAAHQLMLATGIATLLFNANPLLRFDGYYILCDLVEIPNLGGRSNALWLALLRRHLLGDRHYALPQSPRDELPWLLAYAPLSLAYRLALTLFIALFLVQEYPFVGAVLAVVAVTMALLWPAIKGLAFVLGDPSLGRLRGRALTRVGLAGLALLLLLALPAPRSVVAEGVLWVPPQAELRAPNEGTVRRLLAAGGQRVEPGAALIEIADPDLDSEWQAQGARVRELEVRAEAERASDRVRAALTDGELERERAALALLAARRAALTVHAASSGRLQLNGERDLPSRPVARGDLFGFVDTPDSPRVRAVLGQDDVGLVREALRGVEVVLADSPWQRIGARLQRDAAGGISRLPTQALAHAGGGPWATDPAADDGLRTLQRVFEVDLLIAERPPRSQIGTRAFVKFRLEPEALALQGWRRARQLFLARLEL